VPYRQALGAVRARWGLARMFGPCRSFTFQSVGVCWIKELKRNLSRAKVPKIEQIDEIINVADIETGIVLMVAYCVVRLRISVIEGGNGLPRDVRNLDFGTILNNISSPE
jgi:hypothetical protein